jgi:cytidine deaminase
MSLTCCAERSIVISAIFASGPKLFECLQKPAAPRICNEDRQCRVALVRFHCEMKDFWVVAIFDYNSIKFKIPKRFQCFDAPAAQH